MDYKEAWDYVGGLSAPSKMPCYSYSIPATKCVTGSKLHEVEKSVCFDCYALKGFYHMGNVKKALERRYKSLSKPRWVEAFVILLSKESWFRWHDSGDIQSIAHLENIAEIARQTPNCRHWLPTKEYGFVKEWAGKYKHPTNLTIRLSAHIVDGPLPIALAKKVGATTAGCHTTVNKLAAGTVECIAMKQDHKCLDCRLCWDPAVMAVSYAKH